MIKIKTKQGCYFCDALKKELKKLEVSFEEIPSPNEPVVPIILNSNDEILFQGLPKKEKLHQILIYSKLGKAGGGSPYYRSSV